MLRTTDEEPDLVETQIVLEAERRALTAVLLRLDSATVLLPTLSERRYWSGSASSAYSRGVEELWRLIPQCRAALETARIELGRTLTAVAIHVR
jgi:hypothetical protein